MYRPYSSTPTDFRPLRDVESQLRDYTQDFATSFNTGNYDQAASIFAHDGVLMAPRLEAAYGEKAGERPAATGRGGIQRSTSGDDARGPLRRHGYGTGTVHRHRKMRGWNHDPRTRQVCESVAAAGRVASCSRL